jgi:hypothetical protein
MPPDGIFAEDASQLLQPVRDLRPGLLEPASAAGPARARIGSHPWSRRNDCIVGVNPNVWKVTIPLLSDSVLTTAVA